MESPTQLTDREILLELGPEDWRFLHSREKWLARPWAQALNVHVKSISFKGRSAQLLSVKIAQASPKTATFLVATIKQRLHAEQAHVDDVEAFRVALPERMLTILQLPLERFPNSDFITHDCASHNEDADSAPEDQVHLHEDGPDSIEVADNATGEASDAGPSETSKAPCETDSGNSEATLPAFTDELSLTLAALGLSRDVALEQVEVLRESLAAGKRPAPGLLDGPAEWCELWERVPEGVNTLVDAHAHVEAQANRALELANDSALLESVTSLTFPDQNQRAVDVIVVAQEDIATWALPLDEGSRRDLQALLGILWDDSPDESHVQAVGDRFGHQLLWAASTVAPHRPEGPDAESDSLTWAPVVDALDEEGASVDSSSADSSSILGPEQSTSPDAVAGVHSVMSRSSEPESDPVDPEFQLVEPEPAERQRPVPEMRVPDQRVDHALSRAQEAIAPRPPTEEAHAGNIGVDSPADSADPRLSMNTPPHLEGDLDGLADYVAGFEAAAARGDFGLAYWYAVAGGDEVRSLAAHVLVLATSSELTAGSPHPRADAIASKLGGDLGEVPPSVREDVAAALVPAALLLPPYSEATLSLNAAANRLGDDCPTFIRIAHLLTYERGSGLHTLEAPALLASRDRARAELEEFRDRASSRTIRFHRATEVWRELIRQQGLLGSLVDRALQEPSEALRVELSRLDDRAIERLIKDTDRHLNPMQAKRQGIIAGAKQELVNSIQRYVDLTRAYLAAEESVRAIDRRNSHNTDLIEELIAALSADSERDADLGSVSEGVIGWLRGRLMPTEDSGPLLGERELLTWPLATMYELDRDADGSFDPADVTVEMLHAALRRSAEDSFVGYVGKHDYVGLSVLLDALRVAAPTTVAAFEERERRAKAESREVLARALERTRVGLSRALSMTSLTDAEAQDFQDRLEKVARDVAPHYRQSLSILSQIDEELTSRVQKRLDDAAARLASMTDVEDAARNRVAGLILARDLLSAEEFLAQLSNGSTTLPEEDAEDLTLEEFWAVAHAASNSDLGSGWFAQAVKFGSVGDRALPHPSAPPRVSQGLDAWVGLSQQVRHQGWDKMLLDVLNAVGFQLVKMGQRFSPGRTTTSNVFDAQYDGYALTPTFGSSARGRYSLFVCWERKTVDGLLQAVRASLETQSRPTVVFYFQTLKPAERRLLAEQCRRKGLPIIVIDHAAMAYLGTREEARLDGLMHVTLPFSGSNPYTPFALGDVPREMFYGRRDELRAVQDPNGPLFVYGGRQLGKSALLKTAMSEFGRIDHHHVSIYMDLKAEGIGEWHRADDLWRALVPHLQSSQVSERVSRQANVDTVVGAIGAWLAEDERRHLLLLLDEADAFLDQDARPRTGGRGQFKNVYLLKNLMSQSQRRFKPVFAGLHQVQRFHKESNGPMAHIGTEIPVGPLPPSEAYKLVVRPMEAIGYRFTSPDVVWRLLSHTNYQASLIQLFCQELVIELKAGRLGRSEPPSPIDGATVDRVYENRELRGQIAQRFDWTIQLDNRYRVIAHVAAWLNLAHSEAVASVPTLRAQCGDFWPTGFSDVSTDEFRALLDEMVGLGVLVRSRADHYGIRSPNVIRLLGSRDEIERKLLESASLELPTVFDPTRYRRRLADQSRSPLTEAQAARMLSNASEPTLIVASRALGADQLLTALTEIADSGEGVQLFPTTAEGLTETLTSVLRLRRARHVLLDARGIGADDFQAALIKLGNVSRAQASFTASVLVDPIDRCRLGVPDIEVRELTVELWTDIELRAVEPEADVPLDADVRQQMLDLTGGWPAVLEPVLAHGRRTDVAAMLSRAKTEAQKVVDQGWDAFAERIGVARGGLEEQVLTTLIEWGEPVSREDLADLLPTLEPQLLTDALDVLIRSGGIQRWGGGAQQLGPTFRVNTLVRRTVKQGQ